MSCIVLEHGLITIALKLLYILITRKHFFMKLILKLSSLKLLAYHTASSLWKGEIDETSRVGYQKNFAK